MPFGKLGAKLIDTTVATGKEVAQLAALNKKIAEKETAIAKKKEELGDYYWKKYQSVGTTEEGVRYLCQKIEEAYTEIEGYKTEIQKIQEK